MISPPAWSFGGKSPSQKVKDGPGPGAYSNDVERSNTTHKWGSSPRVTIKARGDAPGPGTYSVQSIRSVGKIQ